MLNKALRTPDVDVLFRLRLFIQHLHAQLQSESFAKQADSPTTVYLGQTIQQTDFDDLQRGLATKSTFLLFSQFLFGSSDLSRAIRTATELPRLSADHISVVIHVDISAQMACANTSSLRYAVDENNDVLLDMSMVAKLIRLERSEVNADGIASIYLKLIQCDEERSIKEILDSKRKEVKLASPLISLIKLMLTTNQQTHAEHFVESIYEAETGRDDRDLQGSLVASCHLIGSACHTANDFKKAVKFFHLSLNCLLRFVPPGSVQLSPTYNNIGSMYFRQEEYDKAAEYHQKALQIQIQSTSPNLNSIASYSNNLGVVYLKQEKFDEATKAFGRALTILQEINDPDLASTYDNLGDAYLLQDQYEQALTNYSKALEIQRLIEPRNPQALASFNNSMGNVYNKLQRYGDALIHFKRALECQQEYLSATHPQFASLYNNIGSMHYRQEEYAEALPYYLKSLEIELICLPSNHPTIAVTHFNIATTYTGLGQFEEAIASTHRSVEQLLKTLPDNHPEVIENRAYLETIQRKQMLKRLFQTTETSF